MDNFITEFKKRIYNREAKIAIVGLGYVGLPIAMEFAKKGFSVLGIDIDKDRLQHIKKKESYITDVSVKELRNALSSGRFRATDDLRALREVEVVLICVPTPLKRKYHPDISYIKMAIKAIAKNIRKRSLIVLESTTYPGTTEEVILPLLESRGLKCYEDFYLVFSPERIDPGNNRYPLRKIPKIVGGVTKEATELGVSLYKNIIDKVVPVSSARVAEVVKLLENTFRLVNIGLIDELAMMAHKMDIDIWEVIEAARTKPFGFKSRFIKLASDITLRMPEYVVERVISLLKNKNLGKLRVLIIGVTYKKDVKDLRKSPAIDMIEILQKKNVFVSYYDPLIPYLRFNHINLKSIKLNKYSLSNFDCLVIATNHREIDYNFILKNARLIFDTRGVYKDIANRKVFRL